MIWNRRSFLKAGGLTAMGLGINMGCPAFMQRMILGAPPPGDKKIIFIFQRGGNDGVNTLIPRGDTVYNQQNRPTLFIDDNDAIDLGNGFAQLHPSMQRLMEVFDSQALTGRPGLGNLAIVHRVGYAGQSQSHFDSETYWENGQPGKPNEEVGTFYRYLRESGILASNDLAGISLSSNLLVALKGDLPTVSMSDPNTFTLSGGTPASVAKFVGARPSVEGGPDGRGMLGIYGGPTLQAGSPYSELVQGTGSVLFAALDAAKVATSTVYTPENGAVYPNTPFGEKLKDAAMLLKRTPVRIIGVNKGGWDTHAGQGGAAGYQGSLLQDLAYGIQALSRDLQSMWQDVVIVTMTEFGRTSIENGSGGTDHAFATVVFVAGGSVKGGVYNCDATKWAVGDLLSQNGRYVKRSTDYRNLMWEILKKHMGALDASREAIIPGYAAAAAANPTDFASLNFIA